MSRKDFSEELKQFIFSHIDSVEQLEMLIVMRQNGEKLWTARTLADELRTSPSSVTNRLVKLHGAGLVREVTLLEYKYDPATPDLARMMNELTEVYKVRKHSILELIFSPMKRARNFADAFVISSNHKKDEESDG